MPRITIGSQIREPLEEAGYTVERYSAHDGALVVRDEDGRLEEWVRRDDHAGYTLWYAGMGFEFCRGLSHR
jgi:hypothetical protein